MPKTQIPKEQILEAALQVIIRDGHEQMNIKTVASELKRSTQTISWAFGNMDNFRNEVYQYTLSHVNKEMFSDAANPMEEYGKVGYVYVCMAFDQPNLIRYLHSDMPRLEALGGFGNSFNQDVMSKRITAFSNQYHCSESVAQEFLLNMLIYTKGLISMILAGGWNLDKEKALGMLNNIGADLMRGYMTK